MREEVESSREPADPRAVFGELSKILLDTRPLDDTLQRITQLAKQVIPGTLDVSVTMLDGEQARTVVFPGTLAADLDERQYEAGFGPCMDAAQTGRPVQVATRSDHPYAEFSRMCREAGVTHVLSTPLRVPGRTVGALNTYAALDDDFDGRDVELAATFDTFAAVAVANVASSRASSTSTRACERPCSRVRSSSRRCRS